MSGYGSPRRTSHAPNSLSVPWVIAAAILSGIGIFLVLTWLITSFVHWIYFLGVIPAGAGALMFFDERAGSSHAE
jgi:hypothetical protein